MRSAETRRTANSNPSRHGLEQQFTANRPYDQLVTDLLTADGTVYTNPELNYFGRRDHSAKTHAQLLAALE